jgi:hypothetical protein
MRAEDPKHIAPVVVHSRANGPSPLVVKIVITTDIAVDRLFTGVTCLAGNVELSAFKVQIGP